MANGVSDRLRRRVGSIKRVQRRQLFDIFGECFGTLETECGDPIKVYLEPALTGIVEFRIYDHEVHVLPDARRQIQSSRA